MVTISIKCHIYKLQFKIQIYKMEGKKVGNITNPDSKN